jgi:hypothetical protein
MKYQENRMSRELGTSHFPLPYFDTHSDMENRLSRELGTSYFPGICFEIF